MPIINRNLDSSEKKESSYETFGALATGVTQLLVIAPYNCLLQGVNVAAFGLSGSPVHSLSLLRFAGGQTAIPLASTLTIQAFGTSGAIGFSLAAPGITLLAGDVILVTTGAANTAVGTSSFQTILTALDDVKVYQNAVP